MTDPERQRQRSNDAFRQAAMHFYNAMATLSRMTVEVFVYMLSGFAGLSIAGEFGLGVGLVVGLGIVYCLRRGWIVSAMADPPTHEGSESVSARPESVSVAASKIRRRLSREGDPQRD